MKAKYMVAILLLCISLGGLTACGSSHDNLLSGTYSANACGVTMIYTFEENTVTAQFFMAGYEVGSYEGYYELNNDETQITLTFDPAQFGNGVSLPTGLTSLGGTFTFAEGDGYVEIGSVRYGRVEQDTSSSEASLSHTQEQEPENAESAGTSAVMFRLELPDAYSIQYTVHEEYGQSRDYAQTMTKCADGYYFDFGSTGEQYIFTRLESGKYLQYKYDSNIGEYTPTMITPDIQKMIDSGVMTEDMVAVNANVVSGYAARITTDFDLYRFFSGHLNYIGEAEVADVSCQEFSASFDEVWGKQNAKVWIDPKTGICMKAEYRYQLPAGTVGVRKIECTQWETSEITLPPLS